MWILNSRRHAPACFGLVATFGFLLASSAFAIPSVLTQNYDNMRTGANTNETILTPGNVTVATFGKLFTIPVDTQIRGQMLFVPNLTVQGAQHNVIYASTGGFGGNYASCSLYAFDVDNGAQLFRHRFADCAQSMLCGPAIDPNTNTIYIHTKDNDAIGHSYLHALDITTGDEKTGSPILVQASCPGTGDGNVGGILTLDTSPMSSQPSLLILDGNVYIAFAGQDSPNTHGWILGYHYDGAKFTQTGVFCTTPNGWGGGVWQRHYGLTADASGFLYCSTGNGTFDANTGGKNYSMCYLKLNTPSLTIASYFAPHDEAIHSANDEDLGGGGLVGIPGTSRMFGGGTKFSSAFLLDANNMGGFNSAGDNVLDRIDSLALSIPVIWDQNATKYVYCSSTNGLAQYRYDTALGMFSPATAFKQNANLSGVAALSSNGNTNGIVWGRDMLGHFRASSANDVSGPELWDSGQNGTRDSIEPFSSLTIANGKVYVATSDNIGTPIIAVFGLLSALPPAPTGLTATKGSGGISLAWNASPGATSYNVKKNPNTGSTGPFNTITSTTATTFVDTAPFDGFYYYYVVSAVNLAGESPNSAPAQASPAPVVTTITVSPLSAHVTVNGTQQFTAIAQDQHGLTMSPQPAFTWAVSGGGAINASSGLFTAGATLGGPFTVTAASGSVSGTAQITVAKPAPIVDFNGDGKPDLVLQNASGNQVALWYMNGATVAGGGYLSTTPPAGWRIVGVGDFNSDGKQDVALQDAATNKVALWYLNGTAVIGGAYLSTTPPAGWTVIGVGDFTGDGKPDLALQNASTRKIALWYLNGATLLSGGYTSALPTANWAAVGVGDFDGDGRPDIVFQSTASRQIAIWHLIGTTVTGADNVSMIPPAGWTVVANGDFNHDGKSDLVLQDSATRKAALWYLNGPSITGGAYTSVTPGPGWRVAGPH